MNKNDYIIRTEKETDYRETENLIRESFWNVYRPGCSEHYVMHVLRDDPAFIRELDFVMEKDGMMIGQNMFMKTIIEADDGRIIDVLTMGPICITPELKRKGYGKALLDYSLEKAAEMGFGAVLFEGNIDFYGKSGFDYASRFGIRYQTCRKMPTLHSFSARNSFRVILTVSLEFIRLRRDTMSVTKTLKLLIRISRQRKS